MVFPEEPTCRCGIYYEEQITHRQSSCNIKTTGKYK